MKLSIKNVLFLVLVIVTIWGCIGGGTHGSIKAYRYNVSKYLLEKAVHKVINTNTVIHQDSIKGYYNDDTNYVSISILYNGLPYTYTFRYYGGKEYWDTSTTSAIFIAYAHDKKGKGGSSGNGGVKWYNFSLKKKLTEPFERELVDKIDKDLGMGHVEE